ncbi:unnamed protein product, partial [Symbiodinium natans]
DVRAICNVNASLKGAGQTGHKAQQSRQELFLGDFLLLFEIDDLGIGWKSVFRISDCPHVLLRAQEKSVQTDG